MRAKVAEARAVLEQIVGPRERLIAEGMLEQGIADAHQGSAEIEMKIPEGFTFYQLFPEQYAVAAHKWMTAHKPTGVIIVIGLRSIGTTLSAVVTNELQKAGWEVRRITARPSGPPFDRKLRLPEWVTSEGSVFLIVDEGPGMSGSSFAAARRAIGSNREVHFFPSHNGPPGAAATEETRRIWRETPRWTATLEETSIQKPEGARFVGPSLPWPFDLSGGAVQCAQRAAAESCGIPIIEARDGWIVFERVEGKAATFAEIEEILPRHIAVLAGEEIDLCETYERVRFMIEANIEKAFGLKRSFETEHLPHRRRITGDGRVGPGNWIKANGRIWKRDTTGRGLSHFVAYRVPVVWDVAQAILLWKLSPHEEKRFCAACHSCGVEFSRDELTFWKFAVAAYELGKAVMLRGETGAPEKEVLRELLEQV